MIVLLSSSHWKEFLNTVVVYCLTCPHTSLQNGMVESTHRSVVDVGLATIFRSFVPLKYWTYAFRASVYTLNRVPTKLLDFSSPYFKLFKHEPDISFLRVFGSL